MDDKGIIFTTDLLLAMIIVTIAIGLASSQLEGLNYQIQDFTVRQSLEKVVNDAADYLVKSNGNPTNWETLTPIQSTSLPGLAVTNANGYPESQFISNDKMYTLNNNPYLLVNLLNPGGNLTNTNFNLVINIINPDGSIGSNLMNITNSYSSLASAKEVAVANRTVYVVAGETIFSLFDIGHLNPGHPPGQGEIWYYSGTGKPDAVYVGPGNTTSPNDSFTPDLNTFNYYIYIIPGTGGPGTSMNYAITDGNQPFLNYNYNDTKGAYSDSARYDNLNSIVNNNSQYQWVNYNNPKPGATYSINSYLLSLQNNGVTSMKLWVDRHGSPNKPLSISVIAIPKNLNNITQTPAKLVLTTWE